MRSHFFDIDFPWFTYNIAFSFNGSDWRIMPLLSRDPLSEQQYSTLLLLESAYREQLPPSSTVLAYAKDQRGYYRRLMFRFAKRLDSGLSLVDALEQVPDILPVDHVLALRQATYSETLPQTFAMLKLASLKSLQLRNDERSGGRFYWIAVGLFLLLFSAFIMQSFYKMEVSSLDELGFQPRWNEQFLQAASGYLLQILPWMVLILIILSITGITSSIRRWYVRHLHRYLTFSRDLSSQANLLRIFSVQITENKSLPASLATLAKYHSLASTRQQLLFCRNEIELGFDPWSSLQMANLITEQEFQALKNELSPPSQGWLLERFAERRDIEVAKRTDLFMLIKTPLITILWSFVVLSVAMAVLGSLARLVSALS